MYITQYTIIIYFLLLQIQYNHTLSRFINNYQTLNYEPHRNFIGRHRRHSSTKNSEINVNKVKIKFEAFRKQFYLSLTHDYSVLHPKTEIFIGGEIKWNTGVVPVSGFVENESRSRVFGTLVDGVFRGTIERGYNNSFYVEHSAYHFADDPGFHSIIYHEKDVNMSSFHKSAFNGNICGWTHPNISLTMSKLSQQHRNNQYYDTFRNTYSRNKRSTDKKSDELVCNLFLQSDTFLWDKVMKLHHVNGQHHLAVKEITSIFTQHVQGAQAIYQDAKFHTFENNEDKGYNGIGFRVDRVRINTTEDCQGQLMLSNPFCSHNIDVTHFLNLNSFMNHDDFCLSYIFTYRDFSGGTLGLAWVGEPGGSGGVCEKNRLMQDAGFNVYKSLNTGIVTLLNYGSYVALKVSQLTFAHEVGHNLGSKHDDDHIDHTECLPSVDDPNGNFIMFASATSGEKVNNNKFSKCSKDSITRLLNQVTRSSKNCFRNNEGSFCGNKLTERGEECDCGYSERDCEDQCCNHKRSDSPCQLKKTVSISNISKKVLCSPTAGECCSKTCQFEPKHHICRYSGECKEEAICLGNHAKCPESKKKKDLTLCQEGTRVCKNGECVGSVCEKVLGWKECFIARSDDITPEMMCYVACKTSTSMCISSFDLQQDDKLRRKYSELVKVLIVNSKPIQLKAASPCDNYHGYCDAFLRCRSVEADGPLARIKNMIFSSLMVDRVKLWITKFWWAVILICFSSIVFVGIFIKICSKNTPSTYLRSQRFPLKTKVIGRRSHCHHNSRNKRTVKSSKTPLSATIPQRPKRLRTNLKRKNIRSSHIQHCSRHRNRPISVFQSNATQSATPSSRNMNVISDIVVSKTSLYNEVPFECPPPAYELSVAMPPVQHGFCRGKKGHRDALIRQASRLV